MQIFRCACGNRLFFDNTICLRCGLPLGFLPATGALSALEPEGTQHWRALADGGQLYRKCENYVLAGVCNWMVPAAQSDTLCMACCLNHIIPNLSDATNRERWLHLERAKRRLLYTLNRLGLPVVSKRDDPAHGLAFDLKAHSAGEHVLTGHADGLITLNVEEADPVLREQIRVEMGERYRTLLGHFRHEVGHYYWQLLVAPTQIEAFRALFGDERAEYSAALARHYSYGPQVGHDEFVSDYASAHPWEDWAETWAHYLHMIDTLETAASLQVVPAPPAHSDGGDNFDDLLARWVDLTVVLNELNRSMGVPLPYPFEISPRFAEKLRFVHDLILAPQPARIAFEQGAA